MVLVFAVVAQLRYLRERRAFGTVEGTVRRVAMSADPERAERARAHVCRSRGDRRTSRERREMKRWVQEVRFSVSPLFSIRSETSLSGSLYSFDQSNLLDLRHEMQMRLVG